MSRNGCVGCGYCCLRAPCVASSRLYPGVTQCPQLVWSGELGRYLCRLTMLPGEVGQRYRQELAIDAGCSSPLFNTWREDVKERSVAVANPYDYISNPLSSEFQLFLAILGKQWVSGDLLELIILEFQYRLHCDYHYTEEEAKRYAERIRNALTENRKSYVKDFMG